MRILKILLLATFTIIIYACNSVSQKEYKQDVDSLTLGYKAKSINDFKHKKNTKIVYPDFILNIQNFNPYQDINGDEKLDYGGDSSDVDLNIDKNLKGIIALKNSRDTVKIFSGVDENYFDNNLLEIIPKYKADKFKIYYASGVNINDSVSVKWQGVTDYKPIKDSLNSFFRVPKAASDGSAINEIIKKLKLRDTLLTYIGNADYGEQIVKGVFYKGKPCFIVTTDIIYFKIERFKNNQLKNTKFLEIIYIYKD